ncbi:MAG: DNA translocase FtsK [Syntrophomonadaceae bacterium]|nr:DNA translocase FtsK [Syntrophomonadaceae bacterium]
MKKKKKEEVKTKPETRSSGRGFREEITGILLAALSLFIFVATVQYGGNAQDSRLIGFLGTYLMLGLEKLVGSALLLVPLFLAVWAASILVTKKFWSLRMCGVALLVADVLAFFSIVRIPGGMESLEAARNGLGGGYLGGVTAYALLHLLGNIGTYIIMVLLCVLAVVMILNQPPSVIAARMARAAKRFLRSLEEAMLYEGDEGETREPVILSHVTGEEPVVAKDPAALSEPVVEFIEPMQPVAQKVAERGGTSEYKRPPLDLLTPVQVERGFNKNDIKESIRVLEDTFANFGMKVKVNQVSCGPAVTRYELQPAPGVKVSKIIGLSDDLQLSLAAQGIRIEAPIPGKSAIGLEVPNERITRVGLKNLLAAPAFQGHESPLAVGLGEDIAGNPVILDLAVMPHLLIAGSTGSGKSVCLNSIIISLLYGASPDELRLLLIDPKMVELAVYNGLPHLLTPVITDARKAAVGLRWMVTEMEQRYKKFSEAGVRDIYRYNEVGGEQLPFIVIIIDELADLMLISPVEVEDAICRLAQMARAAGIHLVVATQRPSVDVVTGIIKANIPSRIAFAVSSQADSRTILDMGGAEKLLGRGDMLVYPVGAQKPFRVQGAYVSDADIEAVTNFIKEQNLHTAAGQELPLEAQMPGGEMDYEDELFWEAVKVFMDNEKASVSLLQRRLRVGYARAARLVDMMEERGIISPPDNNKKREILISEEQFEKLYSEHSLGQ